MEGFIDLWVDANLVMVGECTPICPVGFLSFPNCDQLPVDIKKNNLIKTYAKWGPSYKVEFNVLVKEQAPNYVNILHLSATDTDCCEMGSRMPAIWRIFINNYPPFNT